MTGQGPAAFRASVEARLSNLASERGIEVNRLRRHLIFQRVLVRLSADETWVLKGGFALEARLGLHSRVTKDLDLAVLAGDDAGAVHDRLLDALDSPGADHLAFRVPPPRAITPDEAGNPGWRFSVDALMAGRSFASLRLDVVARPKEVEGAVGRLTVPPPVLGEVLGSAHMPTVDISQHAAEKLHALTRTYAGGRPSSRVKDLIDLVLLGESGLLPDPRLGSRLRRVYLARDDTRPPAELAAVPESWRAPYAAMADELGLDHDFDEARAWARLIYRSHLQED